MEKDQFIESVHPVLQGIAVRMLGSVHDAEDIVQDTFLKWLDMDQSQIANSKGYLMKIVTNNCLNHLKRSATDKKQDFEKLLSLHLGENWSQNMTVELPNLDLDLEVERALLAIQEKLEPVERAVFLMKEVFDYSYEDMTVLMHKKKANLRKILSRSKAKLNDISSVDFSDKLKPSFSGAFKMACQLGSSSELIAELSKSIT